MGRDTDFERGAVISPDGHETWVRPYPLPIDVDAFERRRQRASASPSYEREILRRRREHLILRVDRADLSKNVLRGFTAFDIFLEQHPEFRENVTFVAHMQPSRQDVPEYVEYLEKIEALVAVVNHRHGTHRLDADRPAPARRLRRGRRPLQALRRAAGQRDVGRDEPGRQGGPAGQHPQRLGDPVREHRRARGAGRVPRCRSTRSTSRSRPTRSTRR